MNPDSKTSHNSPDSSGSTGALPPKPKKIAVALVRVSTDDQQVEAQEEEIKKWAEETGHTLAMIFRDEGVSGAELDRPGIRALLAYIGSTREKGTIALWHRSRLARPEDPREGIALELKLERTGWAIHYLRGAARSGNLLVDAMMGLIEHHENGQYLRNLSADVMRNLLQRIVAGDVPGGVASYGLAKMVTDSAGVERLVPRTTKHRKLDEERVRWVLGDPNEVAVVRRIFETYVTSGLGYAAIAAQLNAEHIPSPRGGAWISGTIREILTNHVYVGDLIWNKQSSSRFFAFKEGKLVAKDRPRESQRKNKDKTFGTTSYTKNAPADWIRLENHHEAIIERSVFARAAEIMAGRGASQGRFRGQRPVHPLSGLVFCACCSEPMYGRTTTAKQHTYRNYACSSYETRKACTRNLIKADAIERAAIITIQQAVLPPDRNIEPLRQVFAEIIRKKAEKTDVLLDRPGLRREREELEKKLTKAAENMGLVDQEVAMRIAEQMSGWEKRARWIDAELSRDAGRIEERRYHAGQADELAGQLVDLLKDLAKITRESTPAERRALFEKTVKRVDVNFETVPAEEGRTRARHVTTGASVQATDLLALCQEVQLSESKLPGLEAYRTRKLWARSRLEYPTAPSSPIA